MFQFFETIKIKDFAPQNIDFHNQRLNFTRKVIFNCNDFLDLNKILEKIIIPNSNTFKCKVIYSNTIELVELLPYTLRNIQSLKIINNNDINYQFKSTNRDVFNFLFSRKSNCDDILIERNNVITDTSFSNIAFYDNQNWYTPSTPLLKGTKREFLLKNNSIKTIDIQTKDIHEKFISFSLINAMIDLGDFIVPIENIHF
jgi:4-amino-4-deoxychorismate lyase